MAEEDVICVICGSKQATDGEPYCVGCCKLLSPSLVKACWDPFDYALGLRTGEVIRFHEAKIYGQFVHLIGMGEALDEFSVSGLKYPCPRGVDVRLSDIVWVADAPEGS